MNKNSTQKGIRNFITKISDSITILPALPANLRVAGSFILIQYEKLFQLQPVLHSKTYGSFSLENYYIKFIMRRGSVLKTAGLYAVCISNNKTALPASFIFKQQPGTIKR